MEDLLADESFIRYCSGADPDAAREWEQRIAEDPSLIPVVEEAKRWLALLNGGQGDPLAEASRLMDRVTPAAPIRRMRNVKWWMSAAAFAAGLLVGGLWLFKGRQDHSLAQTHNQPVTVDTIDHSGAVLTLADGRKLYLDSVHQGVLMAQGGTTVTLNNGKIVYRPGDQPGQQSDGKSAGQSVGQSAGRLAGKSPGQPTGTILQPAGQSGSASTGQPNTLPGDQSAIAYNTLTTDAGKQYRLVLPDGTNVWLNSTSMIRFPTRFTGKERKVEISGEAYFQIKPDAGMPFMVTIGKDAAIQVVGTQFNVNAYKDDGFIRTTLLEGGIRVSEAQNRSSRILKPGEQARIDPASNGLYPAISIASVDASESIAWMNGIFSFQGMTIKPIMKELSRWYNVDIEYRGGDINDHFYATMPRTLQLDDVLKRLELTGRVKFTRDNRKVLVAAHS